MRSLVDVRSKDKSLMTLVEIAYEESVTSVYCAFAALTLLVGH